MHLARESDARDILTPEQRCRQRLPHGNSTGPPPVFGILLSPPNSRRGERLVLLGRGCNDTSALIHDESPGAASAYVNSEYVDGSAPGEVLIAVPSDHTYANRRHQNDALHNRLRGIGNISERHAVVEAGHNQCSAAST